jgi:protein O-mannosyl-transferase
MSAYDPRAKLQVITLKGFLQHFLTQHKNRPDHPFCFIIGAGASKPSGIPTGGELALQWLEEMWVAENFEKLPIELWATAERLKINNFKFEKCSDFYPDIYERHFQGHPEDGNAFLENIMDGKEPSYGYAVLAYLMSKTDHRIVITTNFDNLMGDALSLHSTKFPLIIGHDSLADFADVYPRRPLVAKIHGTIGFSHKSKHDEIRNLPEVWKKPLDNIFRRCTPVVIGYSGNDGSLMDFLNGLPENVPDKVYWCIKTTRTDPKKECKAISTKICDFVLAKNGYVVPIPGFDELFLTLYAQYQELHGMPDLYDRLCERSRRREQNFDEQIKNIQENLRPKPVIVATEPKKTISTPVAAESDVGQIQTLLQDAAGQLTEYRKEKPWWLWQKEALEEPDIDRQEVIYKDALNNLPNSAPLLGNYAFFLDSVRKDYDRAEKFYRHAIDIDPKQVNNLGNYANFLKNQRQDYDSAEEYYKRAIDINPKQVNNLGNYANFLKNHRKDYNLAEEYYKRAIDANPKQGIYLSNYAIFLAVIRKDYDKAEEYYRRAIDIDQQNADILGNYATFLRVDCKKYDQAEEFYKRAIDANPNHSNNLGNYANFLSDIRKNFEKAKKYFLLSLKANPNNENQLGNYAKMLFAQGKKVKGFEYLLRAEGAEEKRQDLEIELLFYHAAHDKKSWPLILKKMKESMESGSRSPGWPLDANIERAESDGHPNPALLRALARVISDGENIETLSAFPEWVNAK